MVLFFVFLLLGMAALLLWINHLIFADGPARLQGAYLAINVLALGLIWYGNLLHHQMMVLSTAPFDWHSFYRMGLILGSPFLINVLTMIYLLIRRLTPVSIPPA